MSVFCLHRFALSTNAHLTPAEISRYRLLPMSFSLISRQPMKLQISFGFARAMPTTCSGNEIGLFIAQEPQLSPHPALPAPSLTRDAGTGGAGGVAAPLALCWEGQGGQKCPLSVKNII